VSVTFEKCLQVEQEKTGSDRDSLRDFQMRRCRCRAESPLIIIRWKTAVKIIYMLQRIGQPVAKSSQQKQQLPLCSFFAIDLETKFLVSQ
jgi:hypothetical protein